MFNATHKPINLDFNGWHIWHGTAKQRVFANGPTDDTRHLEFADHDEAITWLYMAGHKPLARALNAHVRELLA